MIVIGNQKEICYLLQKRTMDPSELAEKKRQLRKRSCLVITMIEGRKTMEHGLQDIVRNHFP